MKSKKLVEMKQNFQIAIMILEQVCSHFHKPRFNKSNYFHAENPGDLMQQGILLQTLAFSVNSYMPI